MMFSRNAGFGLVMIFSEVEIKLLEKGGRGGVISKS